ncbi:hypothetical protein GQX74_008930 [Glossina fuscipes]|nr:hypothetical protein GQX74_008930 [Glossina fuscipes]
MGKLHQCLLVRNSKTKTNDIEDAYEFLINDSFVLKFCQVKIQTVPAKENWKFKRKETRTKVYEDRKHQIEAAIVRRMKARKRLPHNILVSDVTSQVTSHFLPSPMFIKQRTEHSFKLNQYIPQLQLLKHLLLFQIYCDMIRNAIAGFKQKPSG